MIQSGGAILPEDIEVLGEKIESMNCKDFKLSRKDGSFYFVNHSVTHFLTSMVAPNPVVVEEKCNGCKRGDEVCSQRPKVISFIKKGNKVIPKWDYIKCIRCFCCQELCPQGAIETKYKTLGKILGLK